MKRRLNFKLIILFFSVILLLNLFMISSSTSPTPISSPSPTPTSSPSPTPTPTSTVLPIPKIPRKIDTSSNNTFYFKALDNVPPDQYFKENPYEKTIDGICINCGISAPLTEAEKEQIRKRIKEENPPRNYINWYNNNKFYIPEPKLDYINEDSNYYIIQLYSPLYGIASELENSDREQIFNALKILDATDENAFFVKISKDNLPKVKDLIKNNKIRYLGEIPDESKIDKSLNKKIQDSSTKKFNMVVSIYEENSEQINNIRRILNNITYSGENTISGYADSLKIKEISKLKYVRFIQEDIPSEIKNLEGTMAIGSDMINAKEVEGKGVNVAVLDTGLGDSNEARAGSLKDFAGRIIDQYNFINNDTNINDDLRCNHGTHVAGIIGSDGNLSNGFFKGTAPKVDFLIYKIADFYGSTCGIISDEIHKYALKRASEKDVDIVSVSLGGGHNVYDIDAKFYDKAVRGEYGRPMIAVIAAGNENMFVNSPGTAKNVITVGAVKDGNYPNKPMNLTKTNGLECYEEKVNWPPGERICFSNYGPVDTDDDGQKRIKPDVMAPGLFIISNSVEPAWGYPGGYYRETRGTSMSAPFVSGSIALFLEKYPELKRWPEAIKAQVINTAIPSGPTDDYGYGIIDSYHMLYDDDSFETLKIFGDSISQSVPKEFSFDIPANTKELRITLVWSDPAVNKEAANRIRFDLTLPNNSTITPTFSIDENVLHYTIKASLIPAGNYKMKMNMTAYMEDGTNSFQSFGIAVGAIYKQPAISLKTEAEKPIILKDENFTITAELSNNGYTASGSFISIDELDGFDFDSVDIYKADGSNYTYGQKYNVINYDNLYKEENRGYVATGEIVQNYPRKIVWHLKPKELLAEGEYTFTIKGNARNANEVTSKVTIYYNKNGDCACTQWQDQECAKDICPSGEMLQTRTCSPSSCQIEKRCEKRDYCETGNRGFCIDNAFNYSDKDKIKQITNGVNCANPWKVADPYKNGEPTRYLLIKPGEKQFVRNWMSCTANTASCPLCQVIDFKGRKTLESDYVSIGCTKDYDNNLQLSSEYCDSSKEYSYNDLFFDSPSENIIIPDLYCRVAEVPGLSWWSAGWSTYNLTNAMILYCAQNEDCEEGYYCERPIIGDPLSNYCKKGTGKTITVCKSGTCDFIDPWEAAHFADSGDRVLITDRAIYNAGIAFAKIFYFFNDDGSRGGIYGCGNNLNIEFDCNGATINASGEDNGIYTCNNNAVIKNCKILNAEENIRIQGNNNLLFNLEISDAIKDNIIIFGDNNIVTNSRITNANNIGIYLSENNENNEIKENTIENNTYGIYIDNNNTGTIYNNKIINNTIVGIFSNNNKKEINIYLNELFNKENAYSKNSNNKWYLGEIGNHWNDYDELKEGCIDKDKNHICDSPYQHGEILDKFPITPFDEIFNTPPTTPASVQLAPSKAFKNTEFTCIASGSSDIDNNPITYYYEFRKNSIILQAYSTIQKYICKDNCNKSDLIYCNAKAYDGKDYSNALKSNSIAIQNSAPVLAIIENKKVKENETLSFTIQASDIDKDKLILTIQNLPNGASFKDNLDGTGIFSWIPSFEQSGNYQTTFKVNDGELENKQEINITVENVIPLCANKCTTLGATQCSSSKQQTCSDYNGDACLEWGNDKICEFGCASNICKEGPKPDLTISSFIVQYPRTATIPRNTQISLAFTIKNIGTADATDVFWKYTKGTFDQKNTNPLSIPIGTSKTIFLLSTSGVPGDPAQKVVVDPDNKIAELNEINNEKTLAMQVV